MVGVDRGNFAQPLSSGPAVALLLNHSSWVVIHTCEYCGGVLPVSDTSVRAEHAAKTYEQDKRAESGGQAVIHASPCAVRGTMMPALDNVATRAMLKKCVELWHCARGLTRAVLSIQRAPQRRGADVVSPAHR